MSKFDKLKGYVEDKYNKFIDGFKEKFLITDVHFFETKQENKAKVVPIVFFGPVPTAFFIKNKSDKASVVPITIEEKCIRDLKKGEEYPINSEELKNNASIKTFERIVADAFKENDVYDFENVEYIPKKRFMKEPNLIKNLYLKNCH